jgi:superfamily I DNA/RNA helicase
MAKRRIVKKNTSYAQLDLLSEIDKQKNTPEQNKFIEFSEDKSVILASCAGSGKTYSCVQRLKELLRRGVDPKKIIFFSFTKAATEELQERVGNKDIRITTIHAFCYSILSSVGKFKEAATFHDFIDWFKKKYKPGQYADDAAKQFYYDSISSLYEDSDRFSSDIAAFKLQSADNIKCMFPSYMNEYNMFLKETKMRDFSDMLIEVRDLLSEEKWLRMFRNKYDYIFVDEYQDTSTIQLSILLSLNAKYYYLIGDRNQAIFGFSGSNCHALEQMLKTRREVVDLSLSVNFRSDKKIIENSNRFSTLKATANSSLDGYVDDKILLKIEEVIELLKTPEQVAILVRTNDVIKKIERQLLKRRVPIRYTNFITKSDVENYRKGIVNDLLKNKLSRVKDYFSSADDLMSFIEQNHNSNKQILTIHKSKGKEYDTTVIVNSIDPDLLIKTQIHSKLSKKQLEYVSFNPLDEGDAEPRNIHYVAVSRARHKIYFMIFLVN